MAGVRLMCVTLIRRGLAGLCQHPGGCQRPYFTTCPPSRASQLDACENCRDLASIQGHWVGRGLGSGLEQAGKGPAKENSWGVPG